jgi:hypothetical protein
MTDAFAGAVERGLCLDNGATRTRGKAQGSLTDPNLGVGLRSVSRRRRAVRPHLPVPTSRGISGLGTGTLSPTRQESPGEGPTTCRWTVPSVLRRGVGHSTLTGTADPWLPVV